MLDITAITIYHLKLMIDFGPKPYMEKAIRIATVVALSVAPFSLFANPFSGELTRAEPVYEFTGATPADEGLKQPKGRDRLSRPNLKTNQTINPKPLISIRRALIKTENVYHDSLVRL